MKYEYLTVDNAKVGDKVVLANPNPCYSVGNANPAIDTHFFCHGTVTNVERPTISVEWDNKSGNIYVDNELALSKRKSIMGGTENGKYTSIW
jgi:hypothetical protein